METCRRCMGNCDSGELVQGICPECIEEIKKEREREEETDRLSSAPFCQMSMDFGREAPLGGGRDAICS